MYLGLDLGTSGLKALIIDGEQRPIDSATAPLEVSRPQRGWSEQEPQDWIDACRRALAELSGRHDLSAVRGIGLSGQMHGATILGADDRPLRPAILWNDTRSYVEAAELDALPRFREVTGNIVFPGFTAPKLVWVARNEPAVFERVARVLLPKDYLRLWLTGEHISDMSDSAGTSWLDVGKRRWDAELLSLTGLGIEQMPALVEGTEIGGRLRAETAAQLDLPAGIPVAGGGGDNAASAIGLGAVQDGAAFASLGTSGVLFVANGAYAPNAASAVHAFCHALPDTWHQMGVILSATDCLNWLARITGARPSDLTAELGEDVAAPGETLFLPYLSGERTPHNDSVIRGQFLNISHRTGRAELTRAVLEGVAFAFRDCLEALRVAGTTVSSVTAIGGGSASDYWLQVLANAMGIAVELPRDGDFGAAFGAARLGLIAAEAADPATVCLPPETQKTFAPEKATADAFEAQYARYRAAYPAVRALADQPSL